ncbi:MULTISPECIES: helix-turn-helix transcriptional regulator [unclassified Crossiella]|uniref:helix-turn-helix domain-containing protein n=1 Tax=unclassified Crossiella TaxID=2620835 RepID=UPI001FFFEEED|nr:MULTISPECIES: helix-turn-helix transcriptional regulator [unclassified Crossiella]MCK2240940.1 helix-turn-helix transcriptional regulator [Crossiella sp. S99.2]MCK2253916.1 helix-turn-helix transcriptional regulator [Crossiella sp. S99.1]
MTVRDDVLARKWLVGVELTNYRAVTKVTQAAVAKALGISQSMVSQYEKGLHFPEDEQIATMLDFYGQPSDVARRLIDLASWPPPETDWLAKWSRLIPERNRIFIGCEGFASAVFRYQPLLIPAMLQTEDYSHGMTAGSARVRPADAKRLVELRMARRERVLDGDLHFTTVIEEHVLDRPAGPPAVMAEQLRFLITMAERPNVDVLILPTSVGGHDALDGRFATLSFNTSNGQRSAGPVVFIEMLGDAKYVTDHARVQPYTDVEQQIRAIALSQKASIEAIAARLAA